MVNNDTATVITLSHGQYINLKLYSHSFTHSFFHSLIHSYSHTFIHSNCYLQ